MRKVIIIAIVISIVIGTFTATASAYRQTLYTSQKGGFWSPRIKIKVETDIVWSTEKRQNVFGRVLCISSDLELWSPDEMWVQTKDWNLIENGGKKLTVGVVGNVEGYLILKWTLSRVYSIQHTFDAQFVR